MNSGQLAFGSRATSDSTAELGATGVRGWGNGTVSNPQVPPTGQGFVVGKASEIILCIICICSGFLGSQV